MVRPLIVFDEEDVPTLGSIAGAIPNCLAEYVRIPSDECCPLRKSNMQCEGVLGLPFPTSIKFSLPSGRQSQQRRQQHGRQLAYYVSACEELHIFGLNGRPLASLAWHVCSKKDNASCIWALAAPPEYSQTRIETQSCASWKVGDSLWSFPRTRSTGRALDSSIGWTRPSRTRPLGPILGSHKRGI